MLLALPPCQNRQDGKLNFDDYYVNIEYGSDQDNSLQIYIIACPATPFFGLKPMFRTTKRLL